MSPAHLFRRLASWWRFRAHQDELREELETHRALLAADFERHGLAPDAANAAARRAMGNETLMREEARGVWLADGFESILKDWRYAWRGLRRSPAFTALVVTTVALTIAANTVVFSVVQHVLLAPLPFPNGNRIVRLGWESISDPQVGQFGISADFYRRLSVRSRTLDDFAAVTRAQYPIGNDRDESVAAASVTASFLPMLRIRPALGRGFTPDDALPGAPPVTIIAFSMWQARYAGAGDVLGQVVKLNGTPRTIVGVMPNGFDIPISFDQTPDVWLPLAFDTVTTLNSAFARLRPGATSASASRELQAITREVPDTASARGYRLVATTARDRVDASDARAIQLLFATACGLLLIACANVANLLLMRAWTRRRELAVRLALGAGRSRLTRQVLTESLLLAVIGGGIGLLIAWRGLRTLIAIYPGSLTVGSLGSLDGVALNSTVLAWTAAVSLATGLLFGAGPAFLAGDQSLGDVLRTGGRTSVGSGAARRLRNGLIVAEIALSLVFLAGAGLLVRSFIALARTPIGYDPIGLAAIFTTFPPGTAAPGRVATEAALIGAVRATPGVREAALGGLPQTNVQTGPFAVDGPTGPQPIDLAFCEMPFVSPDYFRVARIPLVQGRTFDASDPTAATDELVVNQALARRLWPGRNALGARLRVGGGATARWLTVVGVAGDIHLPGTTGDLFNLQMYRPTSAASEVVSTMLVRVSGRATELVPALKQAVEGAGVSATFERVLRADAIVYRRILARPRFALAVFGVIAAIALAVCAAGLYGIIAYAVSQRTREIGVRVALGAEPMAVARLVLADSGRLVLAGAALGLVVAVAATRALASFLYQVRPTDPAALGGAILLLVVVALIATLVPVRRALRIDPIDALRTD